MFTYYPLTIDPLDYICEVCGMLFEMGVPAGVLCSSCGTPTVRQARVLAEKGLLVLGEQPTEPPVAQAQDSC